MAKRPTNKVKMKIWTDNATSEMEGTIYGAAYYLFMFVPKADRPKLLEKMRAWHEERPTE